MPTPVSEQPMSQILEEMAAPCGLAQCTRPNQASAMLHVAALVWNATRLTGLEREEAFLGVHRTIAAVPNAEYPLSLVTRMTRVADQYAGDDRLASKVEVEPTVEPGRWVIRVVSLRGSPEHAPGGG